jgi:hypothetical protein
MPRLDTPFGLEGPIIDVQIRLRAEDERLMAAAGLPIPPPFAVRGLVDTGAKVTAIQKSIIAWMGAPCAGFMEATSSVLGSESRTVPIVALRIALGPLGDPGMPHWRPIRAAGVEIVSPGASVLIGRDLLASCRFTYDGRRSRLLMSY